MTKTRWAMVVDLNRCIGCRACVYICRDVNLVPVNWRQLIDCGVGEPPDRRRINLPVSCMNCAEPPCLEVCPTKATYKRADGIVEINSKLCVGCGFCIVSCPYGARKLALEPEILGDGKAKPLYGSGVGDNLLGTCTKCNFCISRIDAALKNGSVPGIDPEATPACVNTCGAGALTFGNIEDPESKLSKLIRDNHAAGLLEELGTKPSVYYIECNGKREII